MTDTSVDVNGLERLLSDFKTLQSLKMCNSVWNAFFCRISQDHLGFVDNEEISIKNEICLDCVGVCEHLIEINFETNVWKHISLISELFPKLQHLTFNLSTLFRNDNVVNVSDVVQSLQCYLPDLKKLTSMTVISNNLNFNVLIPCISSADCGERLTEIVFVGNKSSVIDVSELDNACPNLATLCISHASITYNRGLLASPFLNINGKERYFKYKYTYEYYLVYRYPTLKIIHGFCQ